MTSEDIDSFASFWTSEKDDYLLVSADKRIYGPIHILNGEVHYVIIEDDALTDAVIRRMIKAGVKILGSIGEAMDLAKNRQQSRMDSD